MKPFSQFISDGQLVEKAPSGDIKDSQEATNKTNTAFGNAYETATVLHLHNSTAAKDNPDKKYQAKIKRVGTSHRKSMSALPPQRRKEALSAASNSAEAYLGSLKKHEKISPNQVNEVHHTSQGISDHVGGKDISRSDNPHDLIVKGSKQNTPFLHGASLKARSGTASNNPVSVFEKSSAGHGLNTNLSKHWEEGKKKAGISGMTMKAMKEYSNNPEVKSANTEAQNASASTHAEGFNNASHKTKQKHLLHFLKGNPDVPYHYVVGDKGTSTPINKHPAIAAIKKSKSLTATTITGTVHFRNENGDHVALAEHRPTRGPLISPQVNFKFGTIK